MAPSLEQQVWDRAHGNCEYCRIPHQYVDATFEIEHVVARQHEGATILSNLALACFHCNRHKGPNLSGRDPKSGKIVRLFNPRRHKWVRHFRWDGPQLIGRTPIGRATVATLRINDYLEVLRRQELIEEGLFPPD